LEDYRGAVLALIEAGLLAATDPEPETAITRITPEIRRLIGGLGTR
jgi:hypothetical protein